MDTGSFGDFLISQIDSYIYARRRDVRNILTRLVEHGTGENWDIEYHSGMLRTMFGLMVTKVLQSFLHVSGERYHSHEDIKLSGT